MSYVNPFPKGVYLDNNASMPLLPSVKDALVAALLEREEVFSNPSSIHTRGQRGKEILFETKRELSEWLGVRDTEEWITVSGATEAINTVMRSFAGYPFAFSAVDHASVVDSVAQMHFKKIFVLTVDARGQLLDADVERFIEAARSEKKVLLSWQLANNETGICFALETLEKMKTALKEKLFVMLDAAQAVGKLDEAFVRRAMHFSDYLIFSGHKIGAPTGIGGLWIRPGVPYRPFVTGGVQEKRRRAGTHNTLGIYGLLAALRDWRINGAHYRTRMSYLRERILTRLSTVPGFVPHVGPSGGECLSNTLNFHFDGCIDESLVLALDLENFFVSSGSACNSGSLKASRVLLEMGVGEEEALSSLRVCVGPSTTDEQAELFCDRLIHRVNHIRESRSKMSELLPSIKSGERAPASVYV